MKIIGVIVDPDDWGSDSWSSTVSRLCKKSTSLPQSHNLSVQELGTTNKPGSKYFTTVFSKVLPTKINN